MIRWTQARTTAWPWWGYSGDDIMVGKLSFAFVSTLFPLSSWGLLNACPHFNLSLFWRLQVWCNDGSVSHSFDFGVVVSMVSCCSLSFLHWSLLQWGSLTDFLCRLLSSYLDADYKPGETTKTQWGSGRVDGKLLCAFVFTGPFQWGSLTDFLCRLSSYLDALITRLVRPQRRSEAATCWDLMCRTGS
jgi:hypothetical protein